MLTLTVLLFLDYKFPIFPFNKHRFEIEIEPIFATMALYDLKERKKVRPISYITLCLFFLGGRYCFRKGGSKLRKLLRLYSGVLYKN